MTPLPRQERAFIVEDDPEMGMLTKMTFEAEGFAVEMFQTGQAAVQRFEEAPPTVVLLDLKLPDTFGIEVLERMQKLDPQVPVIILTGYGEVETAVDAIKKGAYHYLSKPFQNTDTEIDLR